MVDKGNKAEEKDREREREEEEGKKRMAKGGCWPGQEWKTRVKGS